MRRHRDEFFGHELLRLRRRCALLAFHQFNTLQQHAEPMGHGLRKGEILRSEVGGLGRVHLHDAAPAPLTSKGTIMAERTPSP